MARNVLTLPCSSEQAHVEQEISEWLGAQGFDRVEFEHGKYETAITPEGTMSGGTPQGTIYHKLRENPGFATFIRGAAGGSLLVMEIRFGSGEVECQAYAPLMVFGFWRKELVFREKRNVMAPYLRDGWEVLSAFQAKFGAAAK